MASDLGLHSLLRPVCPIISGKYRIKFQDLGCHNFPNSPYCFGLNFVFFYAFVSKQILSTWQTIKTQIRLLLKKQSDLV